MYRKCREGENTSNLLLNTFIITLRWRYNQILAYTMCYGMHWLSSYNNPSLWRSRWLRCVDSDRGLSAPVVDLLYYPDTYSHQTFDSSANVWFAICASFISDTTSPR